MKQNVMFFFVIHCIQPRQFINTFFVPLSCIREVTVPFVAATVTAAGTAVCLNKVFAKVKIFSPVY